MSLTKASYSMIQGAPVNILDYMTDAQKADVLSGAGTIDVSGVINSTITALTGYTWKGTTRLTEINCSATTIFFPKGVYLIQSKIRLAPSLRLVGEGHGNFFQEASAGNKRNLNTCFKVDINNYATYAFDTSPFNSSGVRQDNALLRGIDSSNGTATFAENVEFENIEIIGTNTCKCINLAGSPVFRLNNINITEFVIGVRLSASWGGQYNNVRMQYISWKGIIHWYEITACTLNNVYITGMSGGGTVYDPVVNGYDGSEAPPVNAWTQADQNTKTCGIYTYFGGYTGNGVTVEIFQVAFSNYNTTCTVYGIYVEGISSRIIQSNGGSYGHGYYDFYKVVVSSTANFLWSQVARNNISVRSEGATTQADFNKLIEYCATLDSQEFMPVINGVVLKPTGDPIATVGAFRVLTTPTSTNGTWTPNFVLGNAAPSSQVSTGIYQRVNNIVTCTFNVSLPSGKQGCTGAAEITALPFEMTNTPLDNGSGYIADSTSYTGGRNLAAFYRSGSGNYVSLVGVTDTDINIGTILAGSFTYRVS